MVTFLVTCTRVFFVNIGTRIRMYEYKRMLNNKLMDCFFNLGEVAQSVERETENPFGGH